MSAPPVERCADGARERGDDLHATAFPARRLLLVEVPGPWGRTAVLQSRLDPAVGGALLARADPAGVRIQVVRRPGRHVAAAAGEGGRAALVDLPTSGRPPVVAWTTWTSPAELLDSYDPAALAAPLDPAAAAASGPQRLALVCTHTRHDVCCALRGRPVATALAAGAEPDWQVWETSHLGGDRFAGNVLLLPGGDVFGRLDAADALAAVRRYDAGRLTLGHWRGRGGLGNAAQAALLHAARQTGDDGVEAFSVGRVERLDDGKRFVVHLSRGDAPLEVTLAPRWATPERLTCAALEPRPALVFDLVDVRSQ